MIEVFSTEVSVARNSGVWQWCWLGSMGLMLSSAASSAAAWEAVEVRGGLPGIHGALDGDHALGRDREVSGKPAHGAADTPVRIAYLGGSISGGSWRTNVTAWFRSQYPEVTFVEIPAAVGGTSSEYATHRLRADVVRHRPDLVFVEFAVNDAQAGLGERALATMEAIVRQVRESSAADICFLYFPMQSQLPDLDRGAMPAVVALHEQVAARHQVPSIAIGPEVARRIGAGALVWQGDHGRPPPFTNDGVHPGAEGNQLAADIITAGLRRMLAAPAAVPTAEASNQRRDVPPLVATNPWLRANLARPEDAILEHEAWHRDTVKTGWPRTILRTSVPQVPLTLSFTGGGDARLKYLRGPDGGVLTVQVDQSPALTIDTRDAREGSEAWAALGTLPEGRHAIVMTLAGEEPAGGREPTIRIREIRFFGTLDRLSD